MSRWKSADHTLRPHADCVLDGFLLGPGVVLLTYGIHRWKPHWQIEYMFNPPLFFYGITYFPRYTMTSFFTAFLCSLFL